MALTSLSLFFCPLSPPSLLHNARLSQPTFLFLNPTIHSSSSSSYFTAAHQLVPSCGDKDNVGSDGCGPSWLSEELLRRLSGAKDADEAMEMIVEGRGGGGGGEVGSEDCRLIIAAAFERGNVVLALSVFHAMRLGVGLVCFPSFSSCSDLVYSGFLLLVASTVPIIASPSPFIVQAATLFSDAVRFSWILSNQALTVVFCSGLL